MKKGPIREWFDSLLFAIIAATLIRWATFEAFTIPTPSMENNLLVGDFLFVNKLNYGPRTPKTPLQVPLTHQKIWGTNIQSYLDWIQLPTFRLPGFSEIERNDVVVFNYPNELDKPLDLKTYYVKRCVGLPNDTIEIDNGEVKTNDLTKLGTNVVAIEDPVASVSNYLYETLRNEEKRNIYVLKRGFLQQFLDDFRSIMIYDPSSQRVSKSVIKTENTNLTMP